MDAKVDDWVVTPRRGKAVEINALWYNALRLLAAWTSEEGGNADLPPLAPMAEHVLRSFNARFWSAELGYLYDVVDGEQGDDTSLRPNQVFAIALRHPVLDPSHWQPVLDAVERHLLTPVGLRSLASGHPDYQAPLLGRLARTRRGLPPGNGVGLADRAVCRRLAEAAPGRAAPRRPSKASGHISITAVSARSARSSMPRPVRPTRLHAQAWSVAETLRCWRLCAADRRRLSCVRRQGTNAASDRLHPRNATHDRWLGDGHESGEYNQGRATQAVKDAAKASSNKSAPPAASLRFGQDGSRAARRRAPRRGRQLRPRCRRCPPWRVDILQERGRDTRRRGRPPLTGWRAQSAGRRVDVGMLHSVEDFARQQMALSGAFLLGLLLRIQPSSTAYQAPERLDQASADPGIQEDRSMIEDRCADEINQADVALL